MSIAGSSSKTAVVFIAETGGDIGFFPVRGRLAAWARVLQGPTEAAGRVKSAKTRPGHPYLKGARRLKRCRRHEKNSFFFAKYQRGLSPLSPQRSTSRRLRLSREAKPT